MGDISITQLFDTEKELNLKDQEWEQEYYQRCCDLGRRGAEKRLMAIEEKLYQRRAPSFKIEGFRKRTIVTRFGEITISRRLYRDARGEYHFLLDEYLGLPPSQLATVSLQESLVECATQNPFAQVSKTLSKLTAGVLSTGTIYQLLTKMANRAIQQEKADWQAVFDRGEISSAGDRQVAVLFSEGDGTFIHLQREEQKHYEVKQAIAYEGWERLPGKGERYKLAGKRVYCQASEGIPFWEGASLEWAKQWDLSYLKEIVIGGDGANWIDAGLGEFPSAIRQLDGYHLARACGQGWQGGGVIYQAIRAGEAESAHQLMQELIPREGNGVHKSRRYVRRNLEKGRDWRTQSGGEGRGLGTMEANIDKLAANRMKKRGLSWTIQGALRMNKAIQLAANAEIKLYCGRSRPLDAGEIAVLPKATKSKGYQKWLEASLPALVGPHASRPWVENLRHMTNLSSRLN